MSVLFISILLSSAGAVLCVYLVLLPAKSETNVETNAELALCSKCSLIYHPCWNNSHSENKCYSRTDYFF